MITPFDWIIWSLYLICFLICIWFLKQRKPEALQNYYVLGFFAKVLGGVAFALVSVYYYGGDTLLYFQGAQVLSTHLLDDPWEYLKIVFSDDLSNNYEYIKSSINYANTAQEWYMVKILSVLCILSLNSYLVLTLFLSVISFWGAWKLFLVFNMMLGNSKNAIFLIVFAMPSVLFWGTGILKDTITLALINYLTYVLYLVFELNKRKTFYIITSLFAAYVIYQLKTYILVAFLTAIIYIFYVYSKNQIKSTALRSMAVPVMLVVFSALGYFGIQQLTAETVYSTSNIESQIKGFHSWHATVGGSYYNLGEIEYTASGIVKKIPAALNVSFFRPYLWEAKNITSLIGAIESTIVLFVFIFVVFKARLKFFSVLFRNKILTGLFIFILIFGFAIGFTSYNFGALSRYKLPIISLYMFLLIYVLKKSTVNA